MAFTESDVYRRLERALADIFKFYKEDLLVFKGVTSDTGRLYNEIAAGFVNDNISAFRSVQRHYRKASYKTAEYKQFSRDQSNLNTEKQLNLRLFKQGDVAAGKVIDAQTPLFNDHKHKYLGKVGNLLYTADDELFLLNVKLAHSEQTLLRHIVELLLHYQLIDRPKLLVDFDLPDHTKVKIAPLLFRDSYPYSELLAARPQLYRLMAVLDLDIFVIEKKRGNYAFKRFHYADFFQPQQG